MSLSLNFPTIRPTLNLDFASVGMLDPRVTFTRASTATYYNGVTTAVAEQNLLVQSENFATTWVSFELAVTVNTTTAPDGTSTADTLNDGTATNVHDIQQAVVTTTGTTYTMSAFLKNVDRQYAILACAGSVNSYASAKFDLAAGTLGATQASGSGWSVVSSTITSVGNSWYRCTLTFVVGSTTGSSFRVATATDGTTFTPSQRGEQSYTGTNASIYVWGAQFEQRSTVTAYTATTTQPITNYIPVLLTAQNDVPRFDYNPTTGAALGLLIEEQRTNSLTYSDDFANAAWSKTDCSVISNTIVAPDGTLSGDKLIENSAANTGNLNVAPSLLNNTAYSGSVFAKAGEWGWIAIEIRSETTNVLRAWFNISTGAVGTVQSGMTASITSVGNGWYRCVATRTSGPTNSSTRFRLISTNADNTTSTGDGYSGIYLWGAQLEAGAFATSYIPTTTTALTRNADVASMTGTNFSSWYNAAQGTVFCQYFPNAVGPATVQQTAFSISDGTIQNEMELFKRANADVSTRFRVWDNGNNQVDFNLGTFTAANNKSAVVYKTDDFAGILNNGSVATDASGIVPSAVNRLNIGSDQGSVNQLNGCISRLAYYPTRLTNAQLQALTL